MKIAILTFAVTNNYGATLQCYAMQEYLNSKGHETIIINVPLQKAGASRKNRTLISRVYDKFIRLKISLFGQNDGRYLRNEEERKKDIEYQMENMKLFDVFREKYFHGLTHPYIIEEDFIKDYPEADAYIVGSDQVWNPWVTNFQYPIFFLSFVKPGRKRISYAACMGGDENFEFTSSEFNTINALLPKFNSIAVRDQTAISILKKRFNVNATEVMDPTFLPSVNVYDSIIADSSINADNSLFCFRFIINDAWVNAIKIMADYLNLNVRMDSCVIPIEGFQFKPQCSVADWLKLIKTSSFVFTDSFHGMVFCILFKKNFIATPSYKGGEDRYFDLAKKLGLEDRVFTTPNAVLKAKHVWSQPIDWAKVEERLAKLRENSERFIFESLS